MGTQSCLQIANCVLTACQPGDPNCTAKCMAKGTLGAQQTYTAMTDCGKLGCKDLVDAGKGNEAMLCLYTVCGAERGACLGSGAGTCADLTNCLASCGDSVVCQQGCHGQVSDQGAKDYYTLLTCVDQKCGGLALEAKASCAQQVCPLFETCFGGSSGGGSLSCQGILQCASLCGSSKSCAQQCKAQGSAAAQQQLDTLISCNDLNCTSYCNSGNAQLCDFCYSQCVQASGCT